MRILIVLAAACSISLLAQNTPVYPGALATCADLPVAGNLATTQLSQSINSGDTTINVASTSAFPQIIAPCASIIVVDQGKALAEVIRYCALTPTTFTVCADGKGGRGFDGTATMAHSSQAPVNAYVVADHVNQLAAELIAIQTKVGTNPITIPALTPQLGYLRVRPNVTPNTLQFSALPQLVATDYNFPAQTPGGSLTGGVPASITMTLCPLGWNGADVMSWAYISGGVGTAEAVLRTGGTCTSGGSGTITFTPANSHSGAWTIGPANGGIQEAINIAQAAGGGGVFLPATTYAMKAPVASNLLVDVEGTGLGTILDCTAVATVCVIRGDTLASGHFTHKSSTWSRLHLIGPGFSSATIGILMGGDPAGLMTATNLEGHDLTLYDVYIENFNKGIYGGNNSYSNRYYELHTANNAVDFYVGNSTNCCSDEEFFGGRLIGATTAAIQNLAYAQIRAVGTTIEYNRRGFYEDGTSGGGIFECIVCEFETYTDNPADPECISGTGQPVCGPFVDVQSVAPFTLNLYGGVANYATANATYRATNYLIVSGSQNSVSISGTGFGGVLAPVATNLITQNSTTPLTSFLDLRPAFYPTHNVTNLVTTSTIVNYYIRNPKNGATHEGAQQYGKDSGATVASAGSPAGTITPTGSFFFVTGNSAIDTINLPFGGFQGTICMIPPGGAVWTTTIAGNIATATTAVPGKPICATYMPSVGKWYLNQ